MKIKICGITNKEDAANAIALGADALGFICTPTSPRYVSPDVIEEIVMGLPPFTHLVGVFVNQSKEEIEETSKRCKLDLVQLHGQESPSFCMSIEQRVIKAFRIATLEDIKPIADYQGMVSAALLDTKVEGKDGGTGKSFDWGIALTAKEEYELPIILAGGINTGNVKKAIELVNPYAIDIASSIEERPGKKDYNAMSQLIQNCKH